jgi:hypothetical protein
MIAHGGPSGERAMEGQERRTVRCAAHVQGVSKLDFPVVMVDE